jgi:hypothetical protein
MASVPFDVLGGCGGFGGGGGFGSGVVAPGFFAVYV